GRVLGLRDLDPRFFAFFFSSRRRHTRSYGDWSSDVCSSDPVLDRLLLSEHASKDLARERAVAHEIEGALHLPEPSHHVMDAAGTEPLLCDTEAVSGSAERVRDGHAHVGEPHLAVGVVTAAAVTKGRDRPYDLNAWRVRRDDDLAEALMRRRVGIRYRHHDRARRALGARAEPLVRVDRPRIAGALGSRTQAARIGPGDLGLGHGEERADLARHEWAQPARLLLGRPELVEDLGVAGVRRLA